MQEYIFFSSFSGKHLISIYVCLQIISQVETFKILLKFSMAPNYLNQQNKLNFFLQKSYISCLVLRPITLSWMDFRELGITVLRWRGVTLEGRVDVIVHVVREYNGVRVQDFYISSCIYKFLLLTWAINCLKRKGLASDE